MKQAIKELKERLEQLRTEAYAKANRASNLGLVAEEYLESGRAYGYQTAITNLQNFLDTEEDPNTITIFTGDVCVVKQCDSHPYVELKGLDASFAELFNDLTEADEKIDEDANSGLDYFEDCEPNISDGDFDAQGLASAGHGTDEDYGYYGGDDW